MVTVLEKGPLCAYSSTLYSWAGKLLHFDIVNSKLLSVVEKSVTHL